MNRESILKIVEKYGFDDEMIYYLKKHGPDLRDRLNLLTTLESFFDSLYIQHLHSDQLKVDSDYQNWCNFFKDKVNTDMEPKREITREVELYQTSLSYLSEIISDDLPKKILNKRIEALENQIKLIDGDVKYRLKAHFLDKVEAVGAPKILNDAQQKLATKLTQYLSPDKLDKIKNKELLTEYSVKDIQKQVETIIDHILIFDPTDTRLNQAMFCIIKKLELLDKKSESDKINNVYDLLKNDKKFKDSINLLFELTNG